MKPEDATTAATPPFDHPVVRLEPERDVLIDLQNAAAHKWNGSPAAQRAGLFQRAVDEIVRLRALLALRRSGNRTRPGLKTPNVVLRGACDGANEAS